MAVSIPPWLGPMELYSSPVLVVQACSNALMQLGSSIQASIYFSFWGLEYTVYNGFYYLMEPYLFFFIGITMWLHNPDLDVKCS